MIITYLNQIKYFSKIRRLNPIFNFLRRDNHGVWRSKLIFLQRKKRYDTAPTAAIFGVLNIFGLCCTDQNVGEQMIYKFSDFDLEEHFVVAPEALHRFYEKNFGGPVVASWMTKRDRDLDIQDNGEYLSKLYTQFTNRLPEDAQKIILGFSQGGLIAYRWLHRHSIDVDAFLTRAERQKISISPKQKPPFQRSQRINLWNFRSVFNPQTNRNG